MGARSLRRHGLAVIDPPIALMQIPPQVERGVPIPPAYVPTARMPKTPLRLAVEALQIGESFFIRPGRTMRQLRGSTHSILKQAAKSCGDGRGFVVRTVTEGGHEGLRIWRTK